MDHFYLLAINKITRTVSGLIFQRSQRYDLDAIQTSVSHGPSRKAFKSRMHICSNMKPKVFSCVVRASGERPGKATAMDGSQNERFNELRIAVLLRIVGHQASISSITNRRLSALT